MQESAAQPEPTRARVLVSGKVQGVGYRLSTVSQAKRFELNGWVRNLGDGRVEAVFEGEQAAVEEIVNWCHSGPAGAVVQDVAVEYQQPEGIQGFETR